MNRTAWIAIGSNVGDRADNIQRALSLLKSKPGIVRVVQTSFLYETPPMYFEDQSSFLNACAELLVNLEDPVGLMETLKIVENEIGRFQTHTNGPRCIDLDLLFMNEDCILNTSSCTVPHARMQERFFVLTPLNDICPSFMHPVLLQTVSQLHAHLLSVQGPDPCVRVFPLTKLGTVMPLNKSYVVGIVNVTPDSFSDGGLINNVNDFIDRVTDMIKDGVDIIDIGGESTRPNAELVSAEEEIKRVVNYIECIRKQFPHIPISIDTYKSTTARLALAAGANIVNDVSGGLLDQEMLPLVAEKGVGYMCMHAGRIGSHPPMDYGDNLSSVFVGENENVELALPTMKSQLHSRVKASEDAGIYKWNIIVDPGLGFGKNSTINFAIVANLHAICKPFPVMLGASRKRFVRDVKHGREWKGNLDEALVGTLAVTCSAKGASFYRVHDVSAIKRALEIVDTISQLVDNKLVM